ncbi:hypothetical protein PUR61_03145, partial [Streptomyces sp. BE20]|nr:hypothetical protein [Streptomyces sp. BE20]
MPLTTTQSGSTYQLKDGTRGGQYTTNMNNGTTGNGVTDPAVWTPGGSGWHQLSTTFTTGPATTGVTVYLHGWYG